MKKVETLKAPAAIGPYSQAIISDKFVYLSGQLPCEPRDGSIVDGTIKQQTEQVINNLKEILTEASSSLQHVIKTTCYLKNMEDFAEFNKVYEKYFTEKPARACVAVKEIPKGALVEIELVAEIAKEF